MGQRTEEALALLRELHAALPPYTAEVLEEIRELEAMYCSSGRGAGREPPLLLLFVFINYYRCRVRFAAHGGSRSAQTLTETTQF